MNHLFLTSTASDLLLNWSRQHFADPSPPGLPSGSLSAAALSRAGIGWATEHRRHCDNLRNHLRDVMHVTRLATSTDTELSHRLRAQ